MLSHDTWLISIAIMIELILYIFQMVLVNDESKHTQLSSIKHQTVIKTNDKVPQLTEAEGSIRVSKPTIIGSACCLAGTEPLSEPMLEYC